MATTIQDIQRWLKEGYEQGATHVIVKCDTFDYEDYPVFVMPGESPRAKASEGSDNMQRVMECYSLRHGPEQAVEAGPHRTFDYEPWDRCDSTNKSLHCALVRGHKGPHGIGKKAWVVKATKAKAGSRGK